MTILLPNRADFTRITEPADGPTLIESPTVNNGVPTSVLDLYYAANVDHRLNVGALWFTDRDLRAVPTNRDFSRALLPPTYADEEIEVVPARDLHRELTGVENRGRGRPSALLAYPFDVLHRWKYGYWNGALTALEIATEAAVSAPAVHRFVHGEILWWV